MSIFIVSSDAEAASALRNALERLRERARHASDAGQARAMFTSSLPHVLVVDAAIAERCALIEEVTAQAPWARALVARGSNEPSTAGLPEIAKPFDAGEVAATLVRELQVSRATEQRMRAYDRAEELAQIVDASLEAMIGVSLVGVIHAWNKSATRIYGHDEREVIGQRLDILRRIDEPEDGALAARIDQGPRELTRVRKDGTPITVIVSLKPVFGPQGELRGFAELSLDVSAMRKLQLEVEHMDRLAALGQMVASVAHEINNGLGVVVAMVSYAEDRARENGDDELIEAMIDARTGSDGITELVRQLTGFARREPAKLSDAPLDMTLKTSLRLVHARAQTRGVEVTLEPVPGAVVPHDPTRLAQAVVNLLSNAIDAARKTVVVRVIELPDSVEIRVEDDGAGVSPAIASRLFEPFATTKPLGQGTGLGLPIVRQIAEAHGGTVSLVPRPTGGTAAVLTLPRH